MRLYILPLGGCDCDKGRVLTPGSGEGERNAHRGTSSRNTGANI
jgi:hypothetical protein